MRARDPSGNVGMYIMLVHHALGSLANWMKLKHACSNDNNCGVLLQGLCHVNTGGSSAAFGMLTLFIADMAFNFEAISFPVLRILVALIALGTFIAAAVVQGLPARLAVLGGALTAVFPSFAVLPHLKSEKFEWWQPYAATLTTLGFCLALPLYVYLSRLPGCVC